MSAVRDILQDVILAKMAENANISACCAEIRKAWDFSEAWKDRAIIAIADAPRVVSLVGTGAALHWSARIGAQVVAHADVDKRGAWCENVSGLVRPIVHNLSLSDFAACGGIVVGGLTPEADEYIYPTEGDARFAIGHFLTVHFFYDD